MGWAAEGGSGVSRRGFSLLLMGPNFEDSGIFFGEG